MGYLSSLKDNDSECYHAWLILIVGTVLAVMLRGLWGAEGSLDQDGFGLAGFFLVATLIVGLVMLKCKPKSLNKYVNGTVICSSLSIINSLLIGVWNSSLTDAFLLLSICLSVLAALSYYNRYALLPSYSKAATFLVIGVLIMLCIGLIYRSVK